MGRAWVSFGRVSNAKALSEAEANQAWTMWRRCDLQEVEVFQRKGEVMMRIRYNLEFCYAIFESPKHA